MDPATKQLNRLETKLDKTLDAMSDLKAQVAGLSAIQEASERRHADDWGRIDSRVEKQTGRIEQIEDAVAGHLGLCERVETVEKEVKQLSTDHKKLQGAAWIIGLIWTAGTAVAGYLLGKT